MRAPKRKRPQRRTVKTDISRTVLDELAMHVRYVGSPEHKDIPSFAGSPRPRSDASICDRALAQDRKKVQNWLVQAISNGQVGEIWEGKYPRYVWYQDGTVLYEGRLVNREQGEYKGYPLSDEEWPENWEPR
jgi:hypothetical protein